MTTTVTLAWPGRELSPNSRVHWATKAKAVRAARSDTFWTVKEQLPAPQRWAGAVLAFTFLPPDRQRRDLDNLIASVKHAQDGIADALGCDDSRFTCTYSIGPVTKGGAVSVAISRAEPPAPSVRSEPA